MFRLLCVAVALAGVAVAAPADDAVRGSTLLQPFKEELKQALLDGLQQGPEAAIDVCKFQAPAIAKKYSVDGVAVGRSSHRLRNPENVPPDWVSPVIAAYLDADSTQQPTIVNLPGGRTGYVEAIRTQAVCLTCHGENVVPEIVTRLQEEYPHDKATGFALGEIRGVFWAEFPESN